MTPEQREELAACPFCGDAESQLIEHVEDTIIHPAYFVKCDNCGAVGPTTDRGDHRESWNRRAQVEALTRKEKALQGLADERYAEVLELTAQLSEALTVPQYCRDAVLEEAARAVEQCKGPVEERPDGELYQFEPEREDYARAVRWLISEEFTKVESSYTKEKGAGYDLIVRHDRATGELTLSGTIQSGAILPAYLRPNSPDSVLSQEKTGESYSNSFGDYRQYYAPTIPAIPGTKEDA